MMNLGIEITKEEVEEMIREADSDGGNLKMSSLNWFKMKFNYIYSLNSGGTIDYQGLLDFKLYFVLLIFQITFFILLI